MNGEIADPFRACDERTIGAPRQPHDLTGQERDRADAADQRPGAGYDEHQDIEIRPPMRFDLSARSQADDIGIELPLAWRVRIGRCSSGLGMGRTSSSSSVMG
jgi:hypothetical protein